MEGNLQPRGKAVNYFFRALVVFVLLAAAFLLPLEDLTDLPLRPSLRSFPASINCSYAPRTTFLATFSVLASSRSLGSKLPATKVPASINAFNCSRICRVIDSGRLRLTRTFSLTVFIPSSLVSLVYIQNSKQLGIACQTTSLLDTKS